MELRDKILNPDFLAVSGSRLYGSNREDSDSDYRGFVLPPTDYLLGFGTFEIQGVEGADHIVFSMRRFIELVIKGDPHLTELFFVPTHQIIRQSQIALQVMSLRDAFVSKRVYARIIGFGYSEWRKAQGVKLKIAERPKDEEDIIAWIRDKKKWDKERMDIFVDWMNEDHERTLVPSTRKLGAKRKAEFEKFGFGVSSAAHALRLVREVTELMEVGKITFPRPEAPVLRDIRCGKYQLAEVEAMYQDALAKAEAVHAKSELREKPDEQRIMSTYREIVYEALGVKASDPNPYSPK
jgi:hypothetical protein